MLVLFHFLWWWTCDGCAELVFDALTFLPTKRERVQVPVYPFLKKEPSGSQGKVLKKG